jgi:hypothetical protein
MKTATTKYPEILGRDGETKADMLAWFKSRGFWSTPNDAVFTVLCQLAAYQLDLLAGAVTHYGLTKFHEGEQSAR